MLPTSDTLTFRSRIDWWLPALIFGLLGVAAVQIGAELWGNPSLENWVVAGIVYAALAATIWVFTSTAYEVGPTDLVVRSGPIRVRVPIASIRRISSSRTILASPALSMRRLEVEYGKYDVAVVSPKDQAGFIAALTARNPAIEIRE